MRKQRTKDAKTEPVQAGRSGHAMISAGYLVRATYLSFTRVLQKRLGVHKMTSPQWHFMREIWIQEGLNQRELSKRVGTAESTTVSALRVLERRRLIYRESRPRDRRASRVYLTDTGRRLRDDVIPVIATINQLAIAGLSDEEMATLERILAHIRRNLHGLYDAAAAESPHKHAGKAKSLATAS